MAIAKKEGEIQLLQHEVRNAQRDIRMTELERKTMRVRMQELPEGQSQSQSQEEVQVGVEVGAEGMWREQQTYDGQLLKLIPMLMPMLDERIMRYRDDLQEAQTKLVEADKDSEVLEDIASMDKTESFVLPNHHAAVAEILKLARYGDIEGVFDIIDRAV
ncbi:hypothetical protein IAT40_001847 [Kwoniella sp. CBS 6097]